MRQFPASPCLLEHQKIYLAASNLVSYVLHSGADAPDVPRSDSHHSSHPLLALVITALRDKASSERYQRAKQESPAAKGNPPYPFVSV